MKAIWLSSKGQLFARVDFSGFLFPEHTQQFSVDLARWRENFRCYFLDGDRYLLWL
jgi:hypothetical protein